MSSQRLSALSVILFTLLMAKPACAQIRPLDDLGSSIGIVNTPTISADGSTVVSVISSSGHTEAARQVNGLTSGLGFLDLAQPLSIATASSLNGDVIVGLSTNSNGHTEAFRWAGGTMVNLGFLSSSPMHPYEPYSVASGVSGDGSVVVGASTNSFGESEAFRWEGGSMIGLGGLSNYVMSWASAVSEDGKIIVGRSIGPNGYEAFRWSNGSMTGLGFLSLSSPTSSATNISGDGNTIVGWSKNASGLSEAFSWSNGAMTGLGFLTSIVPNRFSIANAASHDGSRVVGVATGETGTDRAFIWTSKSGIQNLNSLAALAGIELAGYELRSATDISANGKIIVGTGITPSTSGTWILRLEDDQSGLSTPEAFSRSFAQLLNLSSEISRRLEVNLDQVSDVARHSRCYSREKPCAFGFVDSGGGGTVGLHLPVAGEWALTASATASPDANSQFEALSDLDTISGSVLFSTSPATGFQAIVGIQGTALQSETARSYENGRGIAHSFGNQSGSATLLTARLGWSFEPTAGVTLSPFVGYTYSRATIDRWSEFGGPFPSTFDSIKEVSHRSKLGVEWSAQLGEIALLWSSIAWAHPFDSEPASIDATVADLFTISTNSRTYKDDWLEMSGGVRIPLGFETYLSASIIYKSKNEIDSYAQGAIGISTSF